MNVLLVLAALLAYSHGWAQGLSFTTESWEEALQLAQAQDKIIFVDAYTTWCGPCRLMDREVFPEATLGSYFNENFINLKLNIEGGKGAEFADAHAIKYIPTLMFFSPQGELYSSASGFREGRTLIKMGKKVQRRYTKQ